MATAVDAFTRRSLRRASPSFLMRWRQRLLTAVAIALVADVAAAQQGTVVLVGSVKDASSGQAVVDAVVTVSSPSLQGEEIAVTDAGGSYRIPALPPGIYVLRVEKENFRPYAREGLDLHADTTIRLNASLLPEALKADEVVVVGRTPTVDVGSSATGMNITSDFTSRIPLAAPGGKGSAARSFEAVADVVPGAQFDAFGVSMFGASSPENRYLLDGLSVSNPTFGMLGTPLSIDFIKEISVLSGGYMPEYGRSTGGILNAITKSGSNEFHGSVFSSWAPGGLAGARKAVRREGQTVLTQPSLAYMADVGAELGGPLIRDRLWFYVGFDLARTRYDLRRSLYRTLLDDEGNPRTDEETGASLFQPIPDTEQNYIAQQDMLQGIAKLTWAVDNANRLTFSFNGVGVISGGDGHYGINPITGLPEIGTESTLFTNPLNGSYSALAHRYPANSANALVKWSSELDGKRLMLDTWLGWHRETGGRLPSDGSRIGGSSGLAGRSNVWWLRNSPPHSLTDFEQVPGGACDQPGSCPVSDYRTGGPEFVDDQRTDRIQGRSMITYLFQALGRHVFKAGVDLEFQKYDHIKAYTGTRDYVEDTFGDYFQELSYGYLTGPDQAVVLNAIHNETTSLSLGGFAQDSWSLLDQLTVNLGLRYDAQLLYAGNGELAMSLPNQWSPRAGVIWDPTAEGHAKLFTSFARYFESVPMLMLDRYLTGEPILYAAHDPDICQNPGDPNMARNECLSEENYIPIGAPPNSRYLVASQGTTPIDPKIKAPSSDEFVLGGEYEIVRDGRLGLTYTKRWLNRTIEDMSRDEAQTYFFGNPGYGIAKDFPKAQRKYDAISLYFTKQTSQGWLGQASYTVSWLRGNYGGLFRAEDLQFDPHQNSDFDLPSLFANRYGPLPGDRRHYFKFFGAKEISLGGAGYLTPGLSFRAYSGEPTNYLGAHPLYLQDQVYILPRGSGERLPWTYSADLRLAYGFNFNKDRGIVLTMDVFNLFNFQKATLRDQRYTSSPVSPVSSGNLADLQNADGTPFNGAVNPNFGRPIAYQPPRTFRFGLKGTF